MVIAIISPKANILQNFQNILQNFVHVTWKPRKAAEASTHRGEHLSEQTMVTSDHCKTEKKAKLSP
jgi:hypothetical protein